MGLLNLLTAYQKKHLVEFLPYHECDTQSRQAPDLECLIKLQAQHTQQRHLIFLTERPFEMFLQYSRNGIVIASIDDVMSGFHSLIGSINQNELPTPPSTGG
ncbi:protein TASOR-like [Seriola lalandi dorsalis]|nr:protein TASOR-like [Seriola lalandi dorsalis]